MRLLNCKRLRRVWAGAALLLISLGGLRGADAPATPALDQVSLQLKWRHQFQFAGYYAAIAQGYYREAGLEVKLIEAKPGQDPADTVFAGRAEFGVGTSDILLLRGQGKPVVVLATIFQHSALVLLARKASGVHDLQDLHDKPIMIEPLSAELFAYFRDEGINPAKLKVENHTFDVKDLISGRVSAMSGYSTDEPFVLDQAGFEYLAFTPRAGGIDFYGDNLFTTEEQIRLHPARVKAFREASLKGWDYALAHPEEIIDLLLRDYGCKSSRAHLVFEAEHTALLMHPGLIEVGHMNPGRWRHMADTYEDFGMLPKSFPLDGFLYDPDPKPDLRWVYWSLAGLGVITVGAVGWLLPLVRLNRRLREEVAARRKTEDELRHAKEIAEEADRAKSHYLAVMSHEVRTPIGGVIGLVNLLQEEPLTSDQRETVDLIEHSADSLLKLISGLLDQARLGQGRMELEVAPLPVGAFTTEICELFRGSAQAKALTLDCQVDAAVPAIIHTDGPRLRQILSNLISNALKFTSQGSVAVTVTMAAAGRVRFSVRDTGMGITAEQQARLFSHYVQADASIARKFGGTGLGLSISRELARLLGGDITVESTPGQGTVFTVEITAHPAASDGDGGSVL